MRLLEAVCFGRPSEKPPGFQPKGHQPGRRGGQAGWAWKTVGPSRSRPNCSAAFGRSCRIGPIPGSASSPKTAIEPPGPAGRPDRWDSRALPFHPSPAQAQPAAPCRPSRLPYVVRHFTKPRSPSFPFFYWCVNVSQTTTRQQLWESSASWLLLAAPGVCPVSERPCWPGSTPPAGPGRGQSLRPLPARFSQERNTLAAHYLLELPLQPGAGGEPGPRRAGPAAPIYFAPMRFWPNGLKCPAFAMAPPKGSKY